jgi:ubiquinone/menaquinone biosynthesis C-methylase UbiE
MVAEEKNICWLDRGHPNYDRWKRGRHASGKRAVVVKKIISPMKDCRNLNVLDLGSGEGGTSSLFAETNKVISYDLSFLRLKRQHQSGNNYFLLNGRAEVLPFRNSSFDLIVLQDVLEHVENRKLLSNEIRRVLKRNGMIYISTPNKYSVMNVISDPHWGMPLISLFRREIIRNHFLRFFRKADFRRKDIAELLSLKELKNLFGNYIFYIKTKEAVQILSEDPEGLLWSSFHLFLYKLLKKTGLFFIIKKSANNRYGIINNFISPTFYIILVKL